MYEEDEEILKNIFILVPDHIITPIVHLKLTVILNIGWGPK
jgi:hypothetical protein